MFSKNEISSAKVLESAKEEEEEEAEAEEEEEEEEEEDLFVFNDTISKVLESYTVSYIQ